MKKFSAFLAAVLMVTAAVAQEQAPQPKNDADARIEALVARMAELEAEVARLRAEKAEAPQEEAKGTETQAPKAKGTEDELVWEPLEKSFVDVPQVALPTDENGTGFHCEWCGGSFFLSADARGKVAELGEYVFCPACGFACWVKKPGVAGEKAEGKASRILLRRVEKPACDEPKG